MQASHDLTLEYAKTRKQFGQPIGRFQVLQHRMADMFIHLEEARSLALLAALKLDAPAGERARTIAMAKVQTGRSGRFIGQSAIQTHGGMGMTDEMSISHYFKRLAMIDMMFGNADWHLKRVAAMA
jgi:alkylation response protein AidB-like acyl-CoA dehydrogenase